MTPISPHGLGSDAKDRLEVPTSVDHSRPTVVLPTPRAGSELARVLVMGLLIVLGFSPVTIRGQDSFEYRSADGGATQRASGVIVDYTGERLTWQRTGGRTESLDAARIVAVAGGWGEAMRGAEAKFSQGDYAGALAGYRAAWGDEKREWVRRQILARSIWCWRNTGQPDRACDMFLQLLRSDPNTVHYSAIPVAWQASQPSAAMERKAVELLGNAELAEARLIGASWLIPTARRAPALGALETLRMHANLRIALLAESQLWRTQLATVNADGVRRWEGVWSRLPEDLRAGPSFVLGSALANAGRSEEAAVAYLRVPILFPWDRELASQALWSAGAELEKLHRPADALSLYREILAKHAESSIAASARERVAKAESP